MSEHLTELTEAASEASMLLFRYDLIRARIQRGLSVETVAERMGMSPKGLIHAMERVDSDPHLSTIRRDAIDLTGCTDAERAAILTADRVWIETLPADDGTTHGVFVRVVDAPHPLDESDHRDRVDADGDVWYRHGDEHWHLWPSATACWCATTPGTNSLASVHDRFGPLRFAESDA